MSRIQQLEEVIQLYDGDTESLLSDIRSLRSQRKTVAKKPAPPHGPVIVSVKDIYKKHRVGKQSIEALRGASLDIYEGEFVAITGASGSGKSTLLQLIGGLDKPTKGTILVDGVDINHLRDGKLSAFRGRTIGFVFQFFYLQPFLKMRQNVEVPGMFAHIPRKDRRIWTDRLLEQVSLTDRAEHLPKELSGGQMQRAAIARALLNKPKILLADEPTGNLDSTNGRAIVDLFEAIRQEFGTTVVVVTHDNGLAARADREIHLKDGVVV